MTDETYEGHGMGAMVHWYDVPHSRAMQIKPGETAGIILPVNEQGEECPWPWDPPRMADLGMGMYHCPYCGAMVLAGDTHPDYRDIDEDYRRYMEAQGEREDEPMPIVWPGDNDHDSPLPGLVQRDLPEGTAGEESEPE